ncbi:hypothetical protein NL529_29740, partial [Klebsiella pneumoniae]|nr:hypothetical protein [Klebsiella pneumoniae]
NKFHDRWLGPFKVTKRSSDLVYEILDETSGKTKRVHFNLLKAARRTQGQEDDKKNTQIENGDEDSSDEEVPLLTEIHYPLVSAPPVV